MLPFTTEQFLQVFERYNQAIWPVHVLAYILGIAIVLLAAKPSRYSNQIISLVLAIFWAWMGVVYHILYFSTINGAALGFGALFVVQACLWLFYGIVRPKLQFQFEANAYSITGLVLIVYAMMVYPLIGMLLGHAYPRSPSFGVAPCPTTIFTFGLLLMTSARVPKAALVIPLLWSLLGFSAAISLGIREDIGLLVAGLLCVGLLLWRDRAAHASNRPRASAHV
jgi:hypothetical protein